MGARALGVCTGAETAWVSSVFIERNKSRGGWTNLNPHTTLPVFLSDICGHWHMLQQDQEWSDGFYSFGSHLRNSSQTGGKFRKLQEGCAGGHCEQGGGTDRHQITGKNQEAPQEGH